MLGIHNFELFLVSGIMLNLTPGSDTMYILSRSISQGKQAGIASVFGISSGGVVHTLLAAFGLSAILAKSALAFNMIKYLGVAYLLYLGIKVFITPLSKFTLTTKNEASFSQIYLQGLLTNVLNPKVALFFLAFLPQFIDPQAKLGVIPFLVLGGTFITTGTIWCLILAMFSARASEVLRNNQRYTGLMNKLCGIIYIALGVNLLRFRA